ncbi:MAG: NAD(P) transhydrogenase subunit alpha [Gemmatimonadota bacterium]
MRIGVLKELAPRETRVALTPDAVIKLVKAGDAVVVERGAGEGAFFADAAYEAAGATLGDASAAAATDLVAKVQCPGLDEALHLASGSVLLCLTSGAAPGAVDRLVAAGVSVLALERVPRISRAQSMDVLSSQATVAGYRAALIGASALPRFLPMLTTAAGSLTPAKALVLGAGVAGLQAIATLRRLGAVVTGFDVRAAAAEQVQSLGARFLAPEAVASNAETAGGYARELDDEQQRKVLEAVDGAAATSDLIVCTAAIPGRPAPRLVLRSTVEKMRAGAVIVDVSAETGGNCELTVPGESTVHQGVTIIGPLNLASSMPQHASQMFSRNVQTLADHLRRDGVLQLDLTDEITGAMCIAHAGALR